MVWLVIALVLGIAVGLAFRLPERALKLLDISIFASLAFMLFGLGVEVAQNPKLRMTVNNHAVTVLVLLASVSLASIIWGWLLERGWSSLWRRA
ncbi:MAG: LysO family transporter [Thermofilum sp.]